MAARRAGWLVAAVAILLVGLAGLVGMAMFFTAKGVVGAGDWAGVLSLALAYLGAMVTLLIWVGRRLAVHIGAPDDDAVVKRLRRAVRLQWAAEVGIRQLRQPQPLRLRVRPTSRAVVPSWPVPSGTRTGMAGLQESLILGEDGEDGTHPARVLVEAFRADPCRQLVILGEAGAGKTTLAMLFTLAMADAADDMPVPVLLSVAGWNPAQQVEQWVAQRIVEDYPALAGRSGTALAAVTRLIEDHRVLPVLDGLDEIPTSCWVAAISDLDRAAGAGRRMVLTCRGAEFEHAVAQAGPLSQAAVVDIEPVQISDVELYLTQREVAGSTRWQPVLDEMRRNPKGPVASTLSTPLMIVLARRAYQAPTTRPEQLVGFPTTDEIQRHLLEQFLAVVYPNPRDNAKARRWLAFLARHLRDQIRDPNLRWWQLARALSGTTITILIAGVVTFVGGLTGLGAAVLIGTDAPIGTSFLIGGGSVRTSMLYGLIVGLIAGLAYGRHTARQIHEKSQLNGRNAVRKAVGAVFLDLGVLAVTVPAVVCSVTALTLLVFYLFSEQRAVGLNIATRLWVELLGSQLRLAAILFLPVGLIAFGVTRGLTALRTGEPHYATLRWRWLLPSLAVGSAVGFAVGLAITVLTMQLVADRQFSVTFAIFFAIFTSTVIGFGRWLSRPIAEEAATSPHAMLRSDRTALILTIGATATTLIIIGIVLRSWSQLTVEDRLTVIGVPLIVAAATIPFGAGTAWIPYTIVRLWLALCGRLPWRLTRFLRKAHTDGILRQVGSAYQFRHEVLRTYLTPHKRPIRRRDQVVQTRARTQLRRLSLQHPTWWRRIIVICVALGALPATMSIVPTPLRSSVNSNAYYLVFSHEDALAGLDSTGTVRLWNTETGQLRRTVHTDLKVSPYYYEISPDMANLATVGEDSKLQLRDLVAGQLRHEFFTQTPFGNGPPLFDFNHDGSTLAIINSSGLVQLWNPVTGVLRQTLLPGDESNTSVVFSPDGSTLAAASPNGVIRLWDTATGQLRQTWHTGAWDPKGSPKTLSFNPAGTTLAIAYQTGFVQFWDTDTGTLNRAFAITVFDTNNAIFSPDGSTLATAWNGHIRLYDTTTGQVKGDLRADLEQVLAIAFNADGSILATSGFDSIRLWEVAMLKQWQP